MLVSSSVTSRRLTLDWAASTDNVAVTSYEVLKDGVVVATTTSSGRTHSETALSSNTRFVFTVRAKDAAGNVSAQSAGLAITTSCTGRNLVLVMWLGWR
ncbi:MAG: fibronectin type III domain-containing protein [Verrucomicrobia bacterium]|nr:fibronectin type III domain-containing protein [Verrucomicrobiota bacterium]